LKKQGEAKNAKTGGGSRQRGDRVQIHGKKGGYYESKTPRKKRGRGTELKKDVSKERATLPTLHLPEGDTIKINQPRGVLYIKEAGRGGEKRRQNELRRISCFETCL